MDRRDWQATVHGVTRSQTQLSDYPYCLLLRRDGGFPGDLLLLLSRFSLSGLLADTSMGTRAVPIDGSPPGSSIHGIFQARVLEWGAIAFSSPSG